MKDLFEWHGGECPVPLATKVYVRLRNGQRLMSAARNFQWVHGKGTPGHEVIAYQLLRTETQENGGLKFDQDKPRMDLIDAYATEELAKVLTFGAKKYAAHNWRKGIVYSRLIAAILRHTYAILRGEWLDPETKLPHAAHIQCTAMFLTWMGKEKPEMNDLWKEIIERKLGRY